MTTALRNARVALRTEALMQDDTIVVDFENGVIRNAALLTVGTARPCNAPAFIADRQTCADAVRCVNVEPGGLRCRITHAEVEGKDGVLCMVGALKNARLVGDVARVDIHLGAFAEDVPGMGNAKKYLLELAKAQPTHLGLSVVIDSMSEEDDGKGSTRARFHRLFAGDVVGEPGGNPRGLLSSPSHAASVAEGTSMTEAQLAYLREIGLPPDATEAEAATFAASLDGEQKAKFEAAATAASAESEAGELVGAGAAASASASRVVLSATQISEIRELSKLSKLGGDWACDMIAAGKTPAQARAAAMAAVAERDGNEPVRVATRARVEVGENLQRTSLHEGIRDAILLRAGGDRAVRKPHERAREFRGLRLASMARIFFEKIGLRVNGLADPEIAMLALSTRRQQQFMSAPGARVALGDGAYDDFYNTFSNVLADAQNKSLQRSYAEAKPKWPLFCSKATAPDFKNVNRPQLNSMPPLTLTDDGDTVEYGTIEDSNELYALDNYTSGWVLTFQQFVNDNLGAFDKLPRMAAHKAVLKQDNLAFAVLSANPEMSDGEPLFSYAHSNVVYAGAVPSLLQFELMQAAAAAQTAASDSANDPLDLELGVLIVPQTMAYRTKQLAVSTVDPASSGAAGNPVVGEFDVVSSARLTGAPYYGAVRPNTLCETIEMCFLEGFEAPRVDMEEDFDSISQKNRLYQPLKAKALDWRGLVKNMGAATSASTT